jgi:PAS domain-containing protein
MKQLLAMLKATADGAFVVDQHGNVVFWNHAAERMLGYRESEILGRPCHDVIQGQSLCGLPLCSAHCAIASRLAFDSLPFPSRQNQPWMAAHLFRNITKQAKGWGLRKARTSREVTSVNRQAA